MTQPRRTAWALVCALLASFAFAGPSGLALAAEPKPQCTGWTDDYHPPPAVRVLRSKGPTAGTVETVDFWKYVGHVVRAEYSSGGDKPYPWMHIGALTVKQYAWYYAGHWRGGKTAAGVCYDLKDTTADQIYTDLKADKNNPGQWIAANVPTTSNLQAMRETWHLTLRKWQVDKNTSRLFLTGYRSGKQRPCGADATGFKIYQKSLRDCGVKKLNFEETLREYYEPNALHVDTRDHDILNDGGSWYGDLGVLGPRASGGTEWRLYPGTATGFGAPTVGAFPNLYFGYVLGQGTGNVDAGASDGANDTRLLADLMMLVNVRGQKLVVARATGTGFAVATVQDVPAGTVAQRLLVADFDGDMLADACLLGTAGDGLARLVVMRSNGNGSFSPPVQWWTGPLNLATVADGAMAGDTNGDGKADLILRDPAGTYSVASSSASCSNLSVWGPCPAAGAAGLGSLSPWLASTLAATGLKHVVGDYDRDGRADVIVVVSSGSGIKVLGLRSKVDGGFADPAELWQSSTLPFAEVMPVALNVNPDGMTDLALIHKSGGTSNVMWLRTNERTMSPASMTPTPATGDSALNWTASLRPF